MLYVFYGNDTATASKKIQATIKDLQKKRPDAELYLKEGRLLTQDFFTEFALSQGLFEQKYIVEIQYPFETADSKDVFIKNLKDMSESDNVFMVLEAKMLKADITKIQKHAQKIFDHSKTEVKKQDINLFNLAEAVGSKDKKTAWVMYQKALSLGKPAEEIHGVIWWQMKSVFTTMVAGNAIEAGMKPYTFTKSSQMSRGYTKESLEEVLKTLVSMSHDAHLGLSDFELSLEKFILNI